MSEQPLHDHQVDLLARKLHAEAIARVPPRTLSQLRSAQHRPPQRPALSTATTVSRPLFGWTLAAGCAAVLALAIGLSPRPDLPGAADSAPSAGETTEGNDDAYGEAFAALEEDPDFYLWLGTTDVQPLAME